MDIAVVVLLVAIVGMLAIVLAVLTRGRTTSDEASTLPVPSPPGVVSTRTSIRDEPLVDVVRSPDGGFQVHERSSGETVLELHPISVPAQRMVESGLRTVPANATLLAGLSGIGIDVTTALSAGTEYVVRFTPQVQKMLDKGSAALMQTSRGPVSDAVSRSTGHILEHGTLVESFAQSPAQVLASGLTAGAAAAQLYQIQAALDRIEKRLDELVGRVRDDDHGELSAAEALVAPLLAAAINGRVPPQLLLNSPCTANESTRSTSAGNGSSNVSATSSRLDKRAMPTGRTSPGRGRRALQGRSATERHSRQRCSSTPER